jgi:hypothetical protein
VFTSAQIKKKQIIAGNEIEMDVFAIVKIDMEKKQIVNKIRKIFLKIGCIKFMDFDLINK